MRADDLDQKCPRISQFPGRVADKWTVAILIALLPRPRRFGELKRSLDGVSQRMLAHSLKDFERDGLVKRTATASIPPRVDHELTELGRSMHDRVRELGHWVAVNLESIDEARSHHDRNKAP